MSATDGFNVQPVGEQNLPPAPFRDKDLSDAAAIDAMRLAADRLVEVALAERRVLLSLGFASEHTFCRNLDRIAREMAEAHSALRRMETARRKLEVPSDKESDNDDVR